MNPTWERLEKLSPTSLESIAREHLQYSNFTIFGYWDDTDNFYEEVKFKQPLSVELASYSLGKNLKESEYWIALKFLLKGNLSSESEQSLNQENLIGNLTLTLDANFKFIDENWSIDINSPFINAKLGEEGGE
jgi:hypothetical protein